MWRAEGTVLRTEHADINLAADRDPTELGWGNSQRTCLGPGKRLGIKTDVYTPMQKNTSGGRKRHPSTVTANRAGGPGRRLALPSHTHSQIKAGDGKGFARKQT